MLNLKSVTDGFRVIFLGFIQNIIILLTMIICVRPPTYEDNEQKTTMALLLYLTLIFYHLLMGCVRFASLYVTPTLRNKMTIFMMGSIVLTSLICQNWVYLEDIDELTRTDTQRQFYIWLWMDISSIYCSIFCSALYIFLCATMQRQIQFDSPILYQKKGEMDFLDSQMVMLDLFCLMFSPAIVTPFINTVVYTYFESYLSEKVALDIVNWLSLAQFFFYILGFFVTRASETRSTFYMKVMSEITYASMIISTVVIPILILIFLCWTMLTSQKVTDLLVYCSLVQLGTIIWVLIDFREPFASSYE